MRKTFSTCRLLLSAIFVFMLLGSAAYGQRKESVPPHIGLVQDWSRHHILYSTYGSHKAILAAARDQRAIDAWQAAIRRTLELNFGDFGRRGRKTTRSTEHRDWSISLGGGTTAATMYPSKYNYDPNATPVCASDFIVFPVNAAGGAAQPNIVGLTNLYSGTAGSTGICNRTPNPGVDDGVSATTLWSYAVEGITGGTVATSPTVSLDGAKVVFVETGAGAAHFHVLAGASGDGVAADLQNVLLPKQITSFVTAAPVEGSGTATDLLFGSATDTLSSPYIDYPDDFAYVGNDAGVLYRIKNVFCITNSVCSGGTPPAPSIDTTFGSGGSVTVCSGVLTGPVQDGVTGNIFVGCSDGKLYGFTSGGTPLTPVTVGDGTATGGIVDPPIIDSVNGFVFATSGSSSGSAVIVQAKTVDLSGAITATLGTGGVNKMHDPTFNAAFFNAPATPTSWLLYNLGADRGLGGNGIYAVTFNSDFTMVSGPAADYTDFGGAVQYEFSPLTEFYNANVSGGAVDYLFESTLVGTADNFLSININAFANTGVEVPNYTFASEGSGTSGIAIDNASIEGQASSVYFGTLNGAVAGNTAVKLTQTGLD